MTVNSPGEVATWLRPVVKALLDLGAPFRVTVFIMPCTYAAGTEAGVVRSIDGVDRVIGTRESFGYALWGRRPSSWRPDERGSLLFLGGEFYLAARLARRTGYEAFAYTEGYINSSSAFARVFVPREHARERVTRRGVDPMRVEVVGDLMVDAAHMAGLPRSRKEAREDLGLDQGRPVVALFLGSRAHELMRTIKLFTQAAALIRAKRPDALFVAALSPFVTKEALGAGLERAAHAGCALLREEDALWVNPGDEGAGDAPALLGPFSIRLYRDRSTAVMAAADLALTIPGSNTAEMAALGLPMVVCVPMEDPEEIPIEGIFGLVDRVPLVGRPLKAAAVRSLAARTRFVALPNRVAGRRVVPELVSESLAPEEVAQEALNLLSNDRLRSDTSTALQSMMGPPGAAARIVNRLVQTRR